MNPQTFIDQAAQRGWSANELQARAKVGSSFFWRWKTGKITPRQRTIDRITNALEEV